MKETLDQFSEFVNSHGFITQLAAAIVILVLGWLIINLFVRILGNTLRKRNFDETLLPFIKSLVLWGARVLLIIVCASTVGIETTSLVAVIGALGLAIGLALQGSLANFAGGVLILMIRPYRVGDYIEAQGEVGTVQTIQIFHTILTTPDGKTVIIPNGPMANGNITNKTTKPQRRVDMTFGIGYSDDIDKAKQILADILEADERVLKDPAYYIYVAELADSSVNFNVRPWVNTEDFWPLYFEMPEKVKKAFDANGISIPFPQRDVHLFKEEA